MASIQSLQTRRAQILDQIAALGPMRKGSITPQYFSAAGAARSPTQRGPYLLYTCKKANRTQSRRLTPAQAVLYRKQIERFGQFQALTRELAELGEQLADLALVPDHDDGKKNSSKPSKPNSKPKRPA